MENEDAMEVIARRTDHDFDTDSNESSKDPDPRSLRERLFGPTVETQTAKFNRNGETTFGYNRERRTEVELPLFSRPREISRTAKEKSSSTSHHTCGLSWRSQPQPRCARLKLKDMDVTKRVDRVELALSQGRIYEDTVEELKWTTACLCVPVRSRTVETLRVEGQVQHLKGCYIIVGIMNKRTGVPKEVIGALSISEIDGSWGVFPDIRAAIRQLRPWWKRFLSLKAIGGFSIYECRPEQGFHRAVDMDDGAEGALLRLYQEYNDWAAPFRKDDRDDELAPSRAWGNWIRKTFNSADFQEPGAVESQGPCLALELVLRWSSIKISIFGMTPIFLSLLVGFWYQYSHEGDPIAIAQTAWSISSFIMAASGLALAVLAAVTQLGEI